MDDDLGGQQKDRIFVHSITFQMGKIDIAQNFAH